MTLKTFLRDLSPVSNIRLYDASCNFLYEMQIEKVDYNGIILLIFTQSTYDKVEKYLDKSISFIKNDYDSIGVYFYEF